MNTLLKQVILCCYTLHCVLSVTFAAPLSTEGAQISDNENTTYSNISVYSRIFNTDNNFIDFRIHPSLITNIQVTFEVRFKRNNTPPVLHFYSKLPGSSDASPHAKKRCFKSREFADAVTTLSKYAVHLDELTSRGQCEEVGEDYVCSGVRAFRTSFARSWWLAIGYECTPSSSTAPSKAMNLSVVLRMAVNNPLKCRNLSSLSGCGYDKTALPNIFGHTQLEEATQIHRLLQYFPGDLMHQHFREFTCRSLYPECRPGNGSVETRVIPPCRKMCEEAAEACTHFPGSWKHEMICTCDLYPDSFDPEVCFYMPVTCPDPQTPEFGQVKVYGNMLSNQSLYRCNDGFRLLGNATVSCTFRGLWNGTAPKCQRITIDTPPTYSPPIFLITCIIIGLILTLILCGLCVYFRMYCIKVKRMYNLTSKPSPHLQQLRPWKSMFLAYSHLDGIFIKDLICPAIKRQLPSWRIIMFDTDFLPGLRITQCIEKSVADSDAFVILLTKHYAESEWCLFEFTQAEMKAKLDGSFKLVFVLGADDLVVDDLQDSLKKGIQTWETLSLNDQLFWYKLCKYLES